MVPAEDLPGAFQNDQIVIHDHDPFRQPDHRLSEYLSLAEIFVWIGLLYTIPGMKANRNPGYLQEILHMLY